MRNHDLVLEAGGNCAVININSIGFGGMAFLRKRSGLVLHAHRNGWDILTRNSHLGFEFSVWQQFWRLLGVDQFQINGIRVKYWEPDESFIRSFKAVTTPIFDETTLPAALRSNHETKDGVWGVIRVLAGMVTPTRLGRIETAARGRTLGVVPVLDG